MKNVEWQCKNCGAHPTSFVNDVPGTGGKCPANGQKHVWERLPEGPSKSNAWQCQYCGARPSSWSYKRPSPGKCPTTGFQHVWKLL